MTYNTLIVLVGAALLGALCGGVGTLTVLRRRALLGDAIAHAALPGIGLAFLILRSKSLPVLLVGALATGLLGVWVIATVRRHSRTKEDAALGLVLSVFFGAGIALSRHIQNAVPDGSQAGLDTYLLGKAAGIVRQDVMLVGLVSLVCLVLLVALFKELRLLSFDPGYAQSLGWNTVVLDFIAMAMVASAVVVGLPMVGIVLVAALTIIPAVAARFWTESLSRLMLIAAGIGAASAVAGALLSASFEKMPTGPVIILIAGGCFVVSALCAPNRGVITYALREREGRLRHGARLVARYLAADSALSRTNARTALSAYGVRDPEKSVQEALRQGWIEGSSQGYRLTAAGKEATDVVD